MLRPIFALGFNPAIDVEESVKPAGGETERVCQIEELA